MFRKILTNAMRADRTRYLDDALLYRAIRFGDGVSCFASTTMGCVRWFLSSGPDCARSWSILRQSRLGGGMFRHGALCHAALRCLLGAVQTFAQHPCHRLVLPAMAEA